ncbi:putative transcription elongation factor [Xylariales sp. AK1849]|nr:putative transcription elongation factor [Xylariales sp. AK1849]
MGKRKKSSRKPQGPRKNEPLATTFTCLFCNHEKSVTVKVDKKAGVGTLHCSVCAQNFQCGANYLSAPIDVYSEWVDAADAVAKVQAENAPSRGPATSSRIGARPAAGNRYEDEDDDGGDRHYEGDGIVGDGEEY